MKFTMPSRTLSAFSCPYCHVFSHQRWLQGGAFSLSAPPAANSRQVPESLAGSSFAPTLGSTRPGMEYTGVFGVYFSVCSHCEKVATWVADRLVSPNFSSIPPNNEDMPELVARLYREAASIVELSPRGAAAILRLALEHLCSELGDPKKKINENIAGFVSDGLDRRTQQALDALRVIGNNAVHPGQIDISDDRETAVSLFALLNLIVEKMLSEKKRIDALYTLLPEAALEAIEKRDRPRG